MFCAALAPTNIVTGNGEWFFDSDSIDIKFENPKFSTSVKGTYDPESNAVTCEAPPLITEETMAPLAKLEEDLTAALEELGEDGDEKKIKKVHAAVYETQSCFKCFQVSQKYLLFKNCFSN